MSPQCPPLYFLLSGTFNTVFLYLLAFNPSTKTLSIHEKIHAFGPHQFIGLDSTRQNAYMTTWAEPSLSAWKIVGSENENPSLSWINTVPITAISSYVQVVNKRIYSAGGPSGEVHDMPPDAGFGDKLQELLYVDPDELPSADKTRVALRYGSHSIDLSTKQAFVPHVGSDKIYVYEQQTDGTLELKNKANSRPSGYEAHDGPRHVVPSRNGQFLYSVTEHTSYVDVYAIVGDNLHHLQRASVIPPDHDRTLYRGDTLRFSMSESQLFVTTRGKTAGIRGWIAVWDVKNGLLATQEPVDRFKTPTSGGKANAIDVFPFGGEGEESTWMSLTDDEQGFVWVVEWSRERDFGIIGEVNLGEGVGASHAVWIR